MSVFKVTCVEAGCVSTHTDLTPAPGVRRATGCPRTGRDVKVEVVIPPGSRTHCEFTGVME